MKAQNQTHAHHAINFGHLIITFIAGGIFIHLFIMLLDYYLMTWPLYLNLRENFMGSIFSAAMIPMMTTYGSFSVATYFLWKKMKTAVLLAREKELQNEKVGSVLISMQHMTGMLAEHIATQN
jgi:riboflavin transporter FmnP